MTKKLLLRVLVLGCILAATMSAQALFMGSADASSSLLYGFRADPFAGPSSLSGAPSLFLALPSGSRYWVFSKNSTGTVTVVDSTVGVVLRRFDLGTPPVAAALTPDGRRILVLTSVIRIFDTSTDSEVGAISGDIGVSPTDFAVSYDSRRAYVLSGASGRLTPVDLLYNSVSGLAVSVPSNAANVSAGPNGEIYVGGFGSLYEYGQDPVAGNLAIRASFPSFNGTPGKLNFAPDGSRAVAINQTPGSAGPALVFDLSNRQFLGQMPYTGFGISRIVVPDNSRFFAVSSGRLYQSLLYSPATVQEPFSGLGGIGAVQDIAISNEYPSARFLYLSSNTSVYRVDLSSNTLSGQLVTGAAAGPLAYAPSTAVTYPVGIVGYNTSQTVSSTGSALPLMVRVTDIAGRPVANASVSFSTTTAGLNLGTPNMQTGVDGLAGTTVSIPSSYGQYSVTASVLGTGLQTSFILLGSGGGGGTGGSSGLQVWSGTGQLVVPNADAPEPLTVKVTDANGVPISNYPVTWYISDQQTTQNGLIGGSTSTAVTLTDSNGFASVTFHAGLVQLNFGQLPVGRTTVTASTSTQSVNFTLLTLALGPPFDQTGTVAGYPNIVQDKPTTGNLTAPAGTTLPGAIQFHVSTSLGSILQGVGLRVFDANDATMSSVCAGGTVFSDASGAVSCDLVAPARVGTVNLIARVASQIDYPITLNVTAGTPSAVTGVQGDNQSGKPGTKLPVPLSAVIVDAAGNAIPNATVTWTVAVPGTVTLSNVVSKSDSQGRVSAVATLGNTPGKAQVILNFGSVTQTFNLTVEVTIGGFTLVSGNNQTATINTAFSQPLVVKVTDPQGNPIPNVAVTYAVTSGVATVNTASATTAADGTASTTVTAGASAGAINVQATVAGQSPINFSLTARLPGPVFSAAQIVNAASFQAGVSPGALVTIFGTGIAPSVSGAVLGNPQGLGPLPLKLQGVEVFFGGTAAPIFSVVNSGGQESVTVQVPYELTAPSTTSVMIRVNGASTTLDNVAVKRLTPGIFEMTDAQGRRTTIVLKSDGSFVSADNPAVRGEKLTVFAAGLGALTPASFTNRVGVANQTVNAPIVVGVNNAGNGGAYTATLSPTMVGLYQITFQLDANAVTGNTIPFSISAQDLDGTRVFSNSSNIAAIR